MAAETERATARAASFLDNDLEGEERGMMREEMLAGKEANEEAGGGGGGGGGGEGEGLDGKKGTGLGVEPENGTVVVGDGAEGGGEVVVSVGKNGWWRMREWRSAAASTAVRIVRKE